MTQNVRDDYLLRRDWRLLNNGSFGACPQPVFDDYQKWQRELEYHPGGFIHRWATLLTEARTVLADYLQRHPESLLRGKPADADPGKPSEGGR